MTTTILAACGARIASIGVSNVPGAMVTTRIPNFASSRATGNVMPTTPAFDAEYAACPICPSNAAIDAVVTITPRSPPASGALSTMAPAASRIMLNMPTRFTLIANLKSSSGNKPPLPTTRPAVPMPAHPIAP
jgi:hypothetical protein